MYGIGGFAKVVDWVGRSYRFARRTAAPTGGKAAIWTSDGATLKFTNEAGTTTNVATASSLSFDDLASGTNTTAAMLVGAGASLGVTSTGTIDPVMSAAHILRFTGRSTIVSASDGNITMKNAAGSDFNMLKLGGETDSFAGVLQYGAALYFRKGGGSNSCNIFSGTHQLDAVSNINWATRNIISSPSDGIIKITNAAGTGGAAIEGIEQTAPAAPAANGYRIFSQDNGAGKTQLMVIFGSGVAQQLAIEP